VPVNAEITFLLFKERRPFKLKKECPSEQWQFISFWLIPLKTPVSFRWTVPLKNKIKTCISYFTGDSKLKEGRQSCVASETLAAGVKFLRDIFFTFFTSWYFFCCSLNPQFVSCFNLILLQWFWWLNYLLQNYSLQDNVGWLAVWSSHVFHSSLHTGIQPNN
jgi:hypothetical protein